ncbi:4Fe-4S dicluster domain-containing protein [Puteibacter caeruleilacunae]|nr:4Fe-4S dicluster domain-containing protein [Puteibacter caeruleilacunae]
MERFFMVLILRISLPFWITIFTASLMNDLYPIYTEEYNCQDCYKCVRRCPVKAIRIEDNKASVLPDYCILCGTCVEVCPSEAKKMRNDVGRAKELLKNELKVIASIAPSFVAEFGDIKVGQLIAGLKELGFYAVSETALGAEYVSEATAEYLEEQPSGVYISSACPSVVEEVRKYHPELVSQIVPVKSPLLAHCELLKDRCGDDVVVVFIGPCIAKKLESDQHKDTLKAAITFQDLKQWFDEEGVLPELLPDGMTFYPYSSVDGSVYPVDGGMNYGIKKFLKEDDVTFMSFSGSDNVSDVLQNVDQWELSDKVFLELLTCRGGCINGPGKSTQQGIGIGNHRVIQYNKCASLEDNGQKGGMNGKYNLSLSFSAHEQEQVVTPTEQEIFDVLETVGKYSIKDHLNCGGCGYNTCRNFAIAMLQGKAEQAMCVSYMRQQAQEKASALLQQIPAAVVVVNNHLKVVECNRKFASLIGDEGEMIFEVKPRMEGSDIKKLFEHYQLFEMLLQSGDEELQRDVTINGNRLHVSLFTIQKKKIVGAIIQDLFDPIVKSDYVKNKAADVIQRNMETVQKIAFLLGENASYTNSMLNSITKSFEKE